MKYPRGSELPRSLERANTRATRLEWVSLVYWSSAIVLLYLTLGSSQAMKAAWIEDILGLFPPMAFLIASRFRHREPNARFPWGYHRSITVAYTVATVALLALGLFILVDSVHTLLEGTHPSIGMVEIFEWQVWSGWVMIAALVYSGIPPLILGRLKQPLSEELHDKVLFADAKMNRADWLTASAAIAGIVGIGLGLWWADAVAAIVISLDIVHDGQKYLRGSISDLIDDSPTTHDEEGPHPLIDRVRHLLAGDSSVEAGVVRMRENGHLFDVDAWVVLASDDRVPDRVEELIDAIRGLDWQLADVVVSPVRSIEDAPEELRIPVR